MDQAGFVKFLKKMGKQDRVIQELLGAAGQFAEYLKERHADLDTADAKDLEEFALGLQKNSMKNVMRGVALYYKFNGNLSLAKLASGIREQAMQTTRKPLLLREFRGVDPQTIKKLEENGLRDASQMIASAHDPASRTALARRSGVSIEKILELVKLADLSRLSGVKAIRARLYVDAGVDTPEKLAAWDPALLRAMLLDFIKQSGFEGIAPLPKELVSTIAAAQHLPKIVEYG